MKHDMKVENKELRSAVFDRLKSQGLQECLLVDYNGSGDSGSLEAPNEAGVTNEQLSAPLGTFQVLEAYRYDQLTRSPVYASRVLSLWEAIEEICYSILSNEHSGWEINEGSSGEFKFNITDQTISLTHNEYYTETITSTREF